MVKEFLSQKGLSFKEKDVSLNPYFAQELVRITGQMGVPVTVVNGQSVIGFDRGRLEHLTAQTGQRPPFGAAIADASKITAKQGSGIILGAYVGGVRPGSIAERIGLVSGDIVTELNLKPIANASDLERALFTLNEGSHFSLSFLRGSQSKTTQGVF